MKKTFNIALLLTFFFGLSVTTINAQQKPGSSAKKTPGAGLNKFPDGMTFKLVKHTGGGKKVALGDGVAFHVTVHIKDSILFDSHTMNNGQPIQLQVAPPKGPGDIMEGFISLSQGDSVVMRYPVDSALKYKVKLPPYAKNGEMIEYEISILAVKAGDEIKKDAEAQKKEAAKQKKTDDKLLQDYFTQNNIKPKKTASGLYYTITEEGTGDKPKPNQAVTVNYTGKTMDGKTFDSNEDTAFHHVEPFSFVLGARRVIPGWDEGIGLIRKGGKGVLYIPSGLAYGAHGPAGIPPNSILIFNVEVIDLEKQETEQKKTDDKLLQDYFTANKIKPKKTASGLYYTITEEGTGDKPKPNQTVTVNYTGKTMDGKTFDSNEDPAFHHVEPFSFVLGAHKVIPGWDEGIGLVRKGGKGVLYIPSTLAYGAHGPAAIPPNSILIFNVEVTDIK